MTDPIEEIAQTMAQTSQCRTGLIQISTTATNSAYNIATAAASTAGKSALFFLGPIFLDPSLFGVYAYFYWVGSVAVSLGSAGCVLAAQRLTSLHRPGGKQQSFMRFLILTTLGLTALALAVLLRLPRNVGATSYILIGTVAFGVVGSIVAVQQAELQAQQDFRLPFFGEGISQLVRLAALWLLHLISLLVPWTLLILDSFVSFTKSTFLVRKNTLFRGADDSAATTLTRSEQGRILTASILPVTLISVLDAILWQRGEIFFLGLFAGAASTAYFASAAQIGQLFLLAPTAALTSLIPKMAEKSLGGREQFNLAANRILNLALLCAIPLFCCGVACGPLIIHFWKPQYSTVSVILPWIMLGRMALLISSPVSLALYASGHERLVLKITAISASIALVVDYLLISHFHLAGAAIATAMNQTLTAVVTLIAGSRFILYQLRIGRKTVVALSALAIVLAVFSGTSMRAPVAFVSLVICAIIFSRERIFLDELRMVFNWRQSA